MTTTDPARPAATIRTFSPDELDAVRAVIARAYAEYRDVLSPALYAPYLADLQDIAGRTADGAVVLVAEVDDQVIGTVTFYPHASTAAGSAWPPTWTAIRALAVEPAYRGHGAARRLVEAAIDLASAGGATVVGLHTADIMSAAVRLYERLGFTRDETFDLAAGDVVGVDVAGAPPVIAYRLDLPEDMYVLGRSAAETRRLILQHQLYGPITRQLLVAAGVTRGMRVLDLGSGAGDVALMLADLVGPEGHVVGVDTNAAILETARARANAAGWRNVEFRRGDVWSVDPGEAFDAVVGRWILMYLDEPAELLRLVATRLRPGGIVAFLESANLASPVQAYPPTPSHELITRWTTPPVGAPGPTVDMGLRLYRTFVDAGLPAPQLRLEAPIGGGPEWPGYDFVADTLRSLLPFLVQVGAVTAEEADVDALADRLRAEVVAGGGVQVLPTVVGAWARRT